MNRASQFDAIIIGCGIAGASLAYFLAKRGMTDILILEREDQPAYHSTGRSAAVLVEMDLIPTVLRLKLMSAGFLRNPPEGFCENPILHQNGILVLFQGELWEQARRAVPVLKQGGADVGLLSPSEAVSLVPVLLPENSSGALHLPMDGHLDVHELLWSYLRHARRAGARLSLGEEVKGIIVEQGKCVGLTAEHGEYRAGRVVNAAGAWAGKIRAMAGSSSVSLTPKRRTIITFDPPEGLEVSDWPLTADLSHDLYFSPESGGLMASPMDEAPMAPCDARPDELTIALTIERLKQLAPRLVPKAVTNKWAGLRTFAPDQALVVGEDPELKGFFWLAGQGGCGIETSPAVGRIASDLILDGRTDRMDVGPLSPGRFMDI
ncbi:MAG: FAD-binding oxidoreductase [Deltaproteobacteria bacterium]|nr:FAD-binding oxidoreductase [Deltaproteobacteria bacterium]MBW1816277.1 FAD-binding oxidoreductase [Deltaproteobacteria bacterium]MBW2284992.1 FAD-binding oxidoreductase [Deltaproteobacteria bacterium]